MILNEAVLEQLEEFGDPGDRHSFLREVVTLYQSEAPKIMDLVHKALRAEDRESLSNLAHKLKGLTVNVGGVRLAERCHGVEMEAADLSLAELDARVGELAMVLSETLESLKDYLASLKAS